MSWLSDRLGIHIKVRLGRREKAAAQAALDALKPRICTAIDDAARSVLSVSINPDFVEQGLRQSLHRRIDELNLPTYAEVMVSLWIDTIDLSVATTPVEKLAGRVRIEADRLKQQVMGARV